MPLYSYEEQGFLAIIDLLSLWADEAEVMHLTIN